MSLDNGFPPGTRPASERITSAGCLSGDDAPIEAAMRADELMEAGDMEGRAVWLRIVKAIEELLSKERPKDAEVH